MANVTILDPTNLTNVTDQEVKYRLPAGLAKKTIQISIVAQDAAPIVDTLFATLQDSGNQNGPWVDRGTIGPWSGSYDDGFDVYNPIENPNRWVRIVVTTTGTVQVAVYAVTA